MWVLWLVASVILAISIFGWPLVFGDDWSELGSNLIGKIEIEMSSNSSYDKMQSLYQKYGGMEIETPKYKGVVCGFCFKYNDSFHEKIIVALTEEKNWRGIHYSQHGDVYVTHQQNPKGYDYLWIDELEQLMKKQ